jgi:hypothetical protein
MRESPVRRLTETFFTGFGLSAVVNVLILPYTSRTLVAVHLKNNLHAIQRTLNAQRQFVQSLPSRDNFSHRTEGDNHPNSQRETVLWPEADALKNAAMDVAKGFGAIKSELRFAKREAGWAYLGPKELVELARFLRSILVGIRDGISC